MKLYLSDLQKHEWLWNAIPEQLQGLKQGQFYAFYFNYSESEGVATIKHGEVLIKVNDIIYRNRNRAKATSVGLLQEPFDSRNTLFYIFLKSRLTMQDRRDDIKRLDNLFMEWKADDMQQLSEQDVERSLGSFEINSRSMLETALQRFIFTPEYVNGALRVCDLLNSYFESAKQKPFYSQVLEQVVRAVENPDGGLMPESNGTMRYMIIGNDNALSHKDETLAEAKLLFRQGVERDDVFLKTGWYANPYDGKWRKRISDADFSVDQAGLTDYSSNILEPSLLYVPSSDTDIDLLAANLSSGTQISEALRAGYKGRIGDIVHHPLLFEYYPEIQNLPLFFGKTNAQDNGKQKYYYSDGEPSHLMFYGTNDPDNIYIMLHEMQHYIQYKQGFANGGNMFLAKLLQAVGGGNVRDFLLSQQKISEDFCARAHTKEISAAKIHEFATRLLPEAKKQRGVSEMVESVRAATETPELLYENCKDIVLHLTNTYLVFGDKFSMVKRFYSEMFDERYLRYFEKAAESAKATSIRSNELFESGWAEEDVSNLFFNTYAMLFGEIESREVQYTAQIPEQFRGYFTMYSSERLEKPLINVMVSNGMPPTQAPESFEGALETLPNGRHIIHLYDNVGAEPFLHEIGHIVEDEVMELDGDAIQALWNDFKDKKQYANMGEWIVENFLCYLVRNNIDSELTKDLTYEPRKLIDYTALDSYFHRVMLYEGTRISLETIERGKEYVDKLLNLVA